MTRVLVRLAVISIMIRSCRLSSALQRMFSITLEVFVMHATHSRTMPTTRNMMQFTTGAEYTLHITRLFRGFYAASDR